MASGSPATTTRRSRRSRTRIADGVAIAEFPTRLEAAQASRRLGMATVMGAPNVVRGGSHSGNASARELAEAGELDILSSDYVPGALLMAAFRLAEVKAIGGLPGAIRLVAKAPGRGDGPRTTAARSRRAAAPICCALRCTTASPWCAPSGAKAGASRERPVRRHRRPQRRRARIR